MVFLPYPGRFIDKPGKSALCRIIEEDFPRVPRADGKSGKLAASRLRSPIDVLKIHLLQDLTIAYDNGVDIVRLEGVDFPTTGTKGLSALLPDKAGDGIVRTLCVVIALKWTKCISTTLGPHFTGALRSQYILPPQLLQGIATSPVGIDLGLPAPIFAAALALATAASLFVRES